jgi:tRNA pseudouridine13 synthase
LTPVRGRFAASPEDFVVEERLAYEPAGEGSHAFLWIEKRGLTTLEAVRRIARFLDRPTHDFGVAGMKDANAVTRQWISIEGADLERLRGWTIRDVKVLRAELHRHKLRLGHGKGNRFRVRITELDPAAGPAAEAILRRIGERGLPNVYGAQRFGRGGLTLDLGLALVRKDLTRFARLAGRDAERVDRRLRSLAISAVQSELFNRVLARRLPALGALIDGDVAHIHASGACFRVESPLTEQPRADRFEISPAGPLLGTKLLTTAGTARALEDAVFAEAGLGALDFEDLPLGHRAAGARRPLRVPVESLAWTIEEGTLDLAFSLPAGSYATQLVHELLGDGGTALLDETRERKTDLDAGR